ncbi:HET-domain-containing protein [Karstenula rhodostoma CBS 690.94]|uniref:HET-domain-containing protein n=1 Tax=Karstenula rhodostoma CBS 690.94 TaxID=1392251 RepID=A0A9P4U968_9PLEO|nr:HET-domain-containing protein [Karstenula rhodostoma CBS 690.94]
MESAAARVDQEIQRLKREVVRDDIQGHSCAQCNHIRLKAIPEAGIRLDEGKQELTSFQLDTTVAETHALAASGCEFWAMVSDKLKLIDLEEKIKEQRDTVAFDSRKHRSWWSDEHWNDLAASLGGVMEKEFQHLRNGPVGWGFSAGANYEMEFAVTHKDFVRVIIRYRSLNDFKDRSVSVDVVLILPVRPATTVLYPRKDSEFEMANYWTTLWVLSTPGNLADPTRACVGSPINLDPGGSNSMELYRCWLQRCTITHNCGIDDLPGSMPPLALDVSDRNCVKLVQVPAHLKERYVALSYCWGTDVQTIMLTRSNENDLLRGISPQELDPTIRDSVTVARELGFRLLWIDALCIFQDDEEWKMRELGNMGKIYQKATLTIVASAAAYVKEGFLHRRTSTLDRVGIVDGYPTPVFNFRAEEDSRVNEEKRVVLRPQELDEIEPWYERAWTLQEMLFSGRRLQFHNNQTTWLCHCSEPPAQEADGWLAGTGHSYIGYSDSHFEAIMKMTRSANESAETGMVLANWYDLVEVYSSRKLRYFHDRLPAISGIAREFAFFSGDQYICGLWKFDLTIGLAWFPLEARHPVSGTKTGPSWSWASYGGAATWWSHKRKKWYPNQDFEILDEFIELVSPSNPFGEVKTAELRVRGLLLPIPMPVRNEYGNMNIYLNERETALVFEYPNDPRVQPDSGFKLSLLVLVNLGWVGAEGIVLLEEGEDRYSRVGWFGIDDVWPVTEENRWVKMRDRTPKAQEELKRQLRTVWGGEQNIRQFVLI